MRVLLRKSVTVKLYKCFTFLHLPLRVLIDMFAALFLDKSFFVHLLEISKTLCNKSEEQPAKFSTLLVK